MDGENAGVGSARGKTRPLVVLGATIVVGLASGVAGTGLVWLLHFVQHVAYGYDAGSGLRTETFLQGASAAPPWRRVCALGACGLVAGGGWWLLQRFARPLVSVEAALRTEEPTMPLGATIIHGLLQVVTVGLGSPLGREAAPREIGAVLAERVSAGVGLRPEERRILVACGAGAGLAAVYNVPFGGAVFALETVLGTFAPSVVGPVLLSSVLAALVARAGLRDSAQYELPGFAVTAPLLVWSALAGPVFGAAGRAFGRIADAAHARAPRGGALLLWCLPTYLAIGGFATAYPQILGNGRSATQLGLAGGLSTGLAAVLLVLRFLGSTASLRAGASGGLMTPSLALGALLAILLGRLWGLGWPGAPLGAYAVVGATAFLAASREMPVTAIVLVAEFARLDQEALFPLLLAVGGAMFIGRRPA